MAIADSISKINHPKSDHVGILESIQDANLANYLKTWQPMSYKRAKSFPSFMYTSEAVYQLERQLFFSKTWICVGHLSQLSGTNSYFTTSIAEIPLLIVSDR